MEKKRTTVTHRHDEEWKGEYEDLGAKYSRRSPFKTGQTYTNTKAAKMVCYTCNNDQWYVGQDDYYTVIMCKNCRKEICIHDG